MKLQYKDKVELTWVDSITMNSPSWIPNIVIEKESEGIKKQMTIKSVGIFIREDSDMFSITTSINEGNNQVMTPVHIPKRAIIEIKKI